MEQIRIEVQVRLGMKQRTIYIGDERIEMRPGVWSYASIVAALVNARYDRDAMEAIVNNYLADPADAEHAAEMAAMQAWRAEAKAIARRALEETSTTR